MALPADFVPSLPQSQEQGTKMLHGSLALGKKQRDVSKGLWCSCSSWGAELCYPEHLHPRSSCIPGSSQQVPISLSQPASLLCLDFSTRLSSPTAISPPSSSLLYRGCYTSEPGVCNTSILNLQWSLLL